jgi:hypothetical protein
MTPRDRALPYPTLVDCGCKAVVYQDGSGVEIDYCALHQAASALYEALAAWVADHDAQKDYQCGVARCMQARAALALVTGEQS